MARRLATLAALVGLSSALGMVTAPPTAAALSQTVEFTSPAPEGMDWFARGPLFFQYVATASASSGLPIAFSVDPASAAVCEISDVPAPQPPSAGIRFVGPGTCTIHADQAGNQDYLPAPRATLSFVIEKVQPNLIVLRK